ncbi:hypothetical protein [Avibacterium endocarditidis]|uniref:Histone n=1 Tax=Avibacterium endocarditidis TaxID=380674 RepID=A0ABX4ZT10_9PAST|nr:hypothetical protein [Avibacterium endocarditidis]POY42623.1 hypothetical protein C3Z13_04385 [Avibacterium endocarditidis]
MKALKSVLALSLAMAVSSTAFSAEKTVATDAVKDTAQTMKQDMVKQGKNLVTEKASKAKDKVLDTKSAVENKAKSAKKSVEDKATSMKESATKAKDKMADSKILLKAKQNLPKKPWKIKPLQ